jgi:hypothetical protein
MLDDTVESAQAISVTQSSSFVTFLTESSPKGVRGHSELTSIQLAPCNSAYLPLAPRAADRSANSWSVDDLVAFSASA